MSDVLPIELHPGWHALVVVCRDCSDRGGAPKRLKPKRLAAELRRAGKAAGQKTRVVQTGCLGLCPKRRIAVVRVGAGEPKTFGIGSLDEAVACVTGSGAMTTGRCAEASAAGPVGRLSAAALDTIRPAGTDAPRT